MFIQIFIRILFQIIFRPLQVTFTNPTSKLAYQLLAAIVRENEVFDSDFVRDGIILNSVGDTSDRMKESSFF